MLLHQLRTVLWKNLIIRKRHWFLTILEAILPVCLFFLIVYGRSKIVGLSRTDINDPTYNFIEGIDYNSVTIGSGAASFLYAPYNEFSKEIVTRMQVKLSMPSDQVINFTSEETLLEYYYKNPSYTTVAVIFDGANPKNLNYKLRYHDPYDNRKITSTNEKYEGNQFQFVPGSGSTYRGKDFLPIQLALDMSFLEYNLNTENLEKNFSVSMQEFPYPPYKSDSAFTSIFLEYLPLITLFSFIFICPAVIKRVVEEKHSGIKELMKMVGMKSWMLWLGWLIYGIQPMVPAIIIIVVLMKAPLFGSEQPMIEYSDPGILFLFLFLYCAAAIAFCFAISSFFSKPTIALVTGILIWILSYFVPKYALNLDQSNELPRSTNIALNFLPNMALHYGYSIMALFEEREMGIQWRNIHKSGSGSDNDVTMLDVYVMLIFDVIFYTLFTFYMDGINPGKYGLKKRYLFFIHDFVKMMKRSKQDNGKVECESLHLKNVEEGTDLDKGIEINRLHKRFGPKEAVHDLKMNVYKNQITVLLGHNGAGKSTTMSIITGMVQATSGSVRINGLDINDNIDEIRQNLGLCPQHNLLFTDLTVKEHLLFFAKLKGMESDKAEIEAKELMESFNIIEKQNALAHTLSGGMKRKLCLGMAAIGGSKVLILDEPSSGMDPESRRHLWDLLLKWRGEKTILITTHFMEEADALGDWIAIMSDGSLKCYGTPMYLKKQYDTGYHLSLMIDEKTAKADTISEIKSIITEYIQEAQLTSISGNNVVFILPFDKNREMTDLLETLEMKKSELHLENISVTITTLEDVFLKTRLETEGVRDSSLDNSSSETHALLNMGKSDANVHENLLCLKMKSLFIKKLLFFEKKKTAYVVPIVVAFILFGLASYLSRNGSYYSNNGPELKLELNSYRQTSVFYNGTKDDPLMNKLMTYYNNKVKAENSLPFKVDDVEKAILKKGIQNIAYYREHMVTGANFDSPNSLIALYNAIALHSLPISLNLIMDSLAKTLLGPEYSISTSNWPLPSINQNTSPQEFLEMKVTILWLIMLPVGCLFIVGSSIIFPHTEISTKFIRMQYMCGVKPAGYWLVNFFADFILYAVLMLILTLFMWVLSPFLNHSVEFGYLYSIFLLYGFAQIPFAYIFSRKTSVSGAFALFIIMGMFLGIILTLTIGILLQSQDEYYINIGNNLKYFCYLFIPQVGLSDALAILSRRAVTIYNLETVPNKLRTCQSKAPACCIESSFECYKFKNFTHVFDDHLLMLGSCVIYMLVNIILDAYWLLKMWSKIRYRFSLLINRLKNEPDQPRNEKYAKRVRTDSATSTLKANKLSKLYDGKQIVKNINLTLNNGQCLGILGVNGAGKTTTFKMLTREECLDQGSIQMELNNETIDIEKDEYMDTLGYCPQADSLNYVLTGRQILTTISNLRGINSPETVNKFLEIFELTPYADKPCGYYSGGNKRKLSLAISLIGFRQFVLLDEPTNGIDPSSRRKCWELIKQTQREKNVSFILTSHSMTECEALCNQLKIMKDGKFVLEGNLAELQSDFGGFTLKLKLCTKNKMKQICDDVDEPDGAATSQNCMFETVNDVKDYFIRNGGELKDEHSGLLHFYIKEGEGGKTWSKIFKEVENIKARNPHLIEDYSISEASLEDIFLKVARTDEEEHTILNIL